MEARFPAKIFILGYLFKSIILLMGCCFLCPIANGKSLSLDWAKIESGKPIYFSTWKYHAGDNPSWADPDFDGRDWKTVNSLLKQGSIPSNEWKGIAWFRIHFRTDGLKDNIPLVLLLSHWGASEIYLNGEKIRTYGTVSPSKEKEEPYVLFFHRNPLGYSRVPDAFPVHLVPKQEYVLAVRYSNHHYESLLEREHPPGFELGFQAFDEWQQQKKEFNRYVSFARVTIPCILIIMFVLHLFLYLFYPQKPINLAFALFLLVLASSFHIDMSKFLTHDFTKSYFHIYFFLISYNISFLFFMIFVYMLILGKIPRHYWVIVGVYALILLTGNLTYFTHEIISTLVALEIWRTIGIAFLRPQKESLFILVSLLLYSLLAGLLQICILFSFTEYVNTMLVFYMYGLLLLLISMSIHLAKKFAVLNQELESMNIELENRVAQRTAELEQANEELRELDKMKSAFVSQASHDLRTPLTAIKGSLDNLLLGIAGELNEKQQKVMSRATKSVDRLTSLVNDVLDLSRIESGRMVLEKTNVPIKTLIENIINENKPAAEQKRIQLSTNLETNATIHADAGKLERVVGEFISNAIKYTPEGGNVDVSLIQKEDEITLSVKDSGIGITKEECEKIWERFYRTNASKSFAKGSGLGLSIAKELVEMHGGKLGVESEKDRGTLFQVYLPIKNKL